GCGTPLVIVAAIEGTLPSPQRHLPLVRSGPSGEPFALAPWQPAQVPPFWPWKICSPRATCSCVWPGGVGKELVVAPAFGWIPSGGCAWAVPLDAEDDALCGGLEASCLLAIKCDPPDAAVLVVGDIKPAIGTAGHSGRPMRGLARIQMTSGETIGKHEILSRRLTVGKRLEHDIVAGLRQGRPVPRAVKGDEGASVISCAKLRAVVAHE